MKNWDTSYKIIDGPRITQSRILPDHYNIPRSRIQSAPFHFMIRALRVTTPPPLPFQPCFMLYVNTKELFYVLFFISHVRKEEEVVVSYVR